jgi:hypothetical protein
MDLIKLSLSRSFVAEKARLAWREILFGIENELLGPEAAVEFASDEIATKKNPSLVLTRLACVGEGEPMLPHVVQLASAEPPQDSDKVRDKWLYLVLAWIYEHQASYADPLEVVEEVYADFGYPSRIAGFVRYMPADEPDLGSHELNEARLYEKWKCYLDEASVAYAHSA